MNPFQKTPKSRCRTSPEIETEEELERVLAAAGLGDWTTAQKYMASEFGIDPNTTGPLELATVIVCAPWSAAQLEGSVRYLCHTCQSPVAASPISSEALLARPELRAVCVPCALKEQDERRKESEHE